MVMFGWSAANAASAVTSVKGKHFEAHIETLRELYLDMWDGKYIQEQARMLRVPEIDSSALHSGQGRRREGPPADHSILHVEALEE